MSNIACFGEPVYSCTLKQGSFDGLLAPCRVVNVHISNLTGLIRRWTAWKARVMLAVIALMIVRSEFS